MYALKDVAQIDIAAEITAMAEFLSERWNQTANVESLLQLIAQVADKNADSAITRYDLPQYLREQMQKREDVLKSFSDDASMLRYYDQAYGLFESLNRQVDKVQRNGDDMLYDAYAPTFKSIKKALAAPELSHLKKAQLKGLRAMMRHYAENDDAWDKALADEFTDKHAFRGADTGGATHGGFVHLASLIFVVQEKADDNTSPIDLLIRAAYVHFVELCKHNNTQAVVADLDALAPLVMAKNPVFTLDYAPAHKLTRVLYALAREDKLGLGGDNPEQEYLASVEERKNQKPLSEDELKARKANALAMLQGMMRNALKPETAKQAKAREARTAREQATVRGLLKSA
jgi:hypothetical protein